jgi:hypothetical protein
MRTKEIQSFLREGIKLGARIAAPLALGYLARNAIVHLPTGEYINLSAPDRAQPVRKQERSLVAFLREVDKHLRKSGLWGIEVEYEGYAVRAGEVETPHEITMLPHARPDFAVAQRGNLPCIVPAILDPERMKKVAFLEHSQEIDSPKKLVKEGHAIDAGLNLRKINDEGCADLFRSLHADPDRTILDIFGNIFD